MRTTRVGLVFVVCLAAALWATGCGDSTSPSTSTVQAVDPAPDYGPATPQLLRSLNGKAWTTLEAAQRLDLMRLCVRDSEIASRTRERLKGQEGIPSDLLEAEVRRAVRGVRDADPDAVVEEVTKAAADSDNSYFSLMDLCSSAALRVYGAKEKAAQIANGQ